MGFGSVMSLAIIIIAAVVFHPRGIQIDRYNQAALMLTPVYGYLGYLLFAASLAIGCYGALLQASMTTAYGLAQGLGWNWGEDLRPKADARFALTYTVTIAIGAASMLAGIDPLKITIFSMALAAAILPLVTIPFVFIMNDAHYLGKHTNGVVSNIAVVGISVLAFAIGVVTIPLELFGG
jgi:Mn2+/Fe2+ NRAMP family transporter